MIEGVGQIAMTVTDLGRAKEFYGKALKLPFLFDAGQMAFYQCGAVRLMLTLPEHPCQIGGTILYFDVTELDETCAELALQGVDFLAAPHEVAKMPDHALWMAFIKDPDGNILGLMTKRQLHHANHVG
jgi:methylmalonyl-CoA/ethylmalonyl-CoA epimerase